MVSVYRFEAIDDDDDDFPDRVAFERADGSYGEVGAGEAVAKFYEVRQYYCNYRFVIMLTANSIVAGENHEYDRRLQERRERERGQGRDRDRDRDRGHCGVVVGGGGLPAGRGDRQSGRQLVVGKGSKENEGESDLYSIIECFSVVLIQFD